jgi:hypothetical protein
LIGAQGLSIADTSGFKINHAIPEPSSVVLLGLGGAVALCGGLRRWRSSTAA